METKLFNSHLPVAGVMGDFSFMEDAIISPNVKVFHMDSYIDINGIRFQGAFYLDLKGRHSHIECPLEILKMAKKYTMRIVNNYAIYTIYF